MNDRETVTFDINILQLQHLLQHVDENFSLNIGKQHSTLDKFTVTATYDSVYAAYYKDLFGRAQRMYLS